MSLSLSYAATSHVGLIRAGNEDSGYGGPRLLAVADGMGGHAAGEVASAVAIARIAELDEDAPGSDLLEALSSAATEANDVLRDMVEGNHTLDGMGTTLTALLFSGARIGVLHIGDSRCYLLRDGELSQITHDDTLVQSLVDEGRITEDEASTHPQRSLITRALDGRADVDFDLSVREARAGDRYLLCTDGLTGPVGRRETLHEALEIAAPAEAAQRLVELALRGGGPDNITVVVADVIDGAQADPPLVVGAAADPASAGPTVVLDSGAAGRAAAIKPAAAPTPVVELDEEPVARGGHGRRIGLIGLGVVLLLALGSAGGYAFVRAQWYVGVQDEQVTVFRGLSGSLLGVDLHSAQEPPTDLYLSELTQLNKDRVLSRYDATSKRDAEAFVEQLRLTAITPPVPSAVPPGTSPSPTPATPGSPTATPAASASPTPAR